MTKDYTVTVNLDAGQVKQLEEIVSALNDWHANEYGKDAQAPMTMERMLTQIIRSVRVQSALHAEFGDMLIFWHMMLTQQQKHMEEDAK